MNSNRLRKAMGILLSISTGVLGVSSSTYAVANAQRSSLDNALGTASYKTVTDSESSDNLYSLTAKSERGVNIDGQTVDVDCTTLEGLFTYEKDVALRQAAESAVLLKNENNLLPLNREAGEMMANLALWNGASGIQAPGSNTHRNAYNARNHEYYSEDGMLSGIMLDGFCAGAWEYGLITTVKHFAFNDTELNRMGVSAFMSEQRARENELRAFQIGIENGNVVGMMMGMNRAGGYFVGANPGIMNIIRNEWAFNGLVTTDMTKGNYDNSRDSLASGVDSMLQTLSADKVTASRDELLKKWGGDPLYATGTVTDLVAKDTYFLTQIQTALKHITWVIANSNYMNGIDKTTKLVRVNTWYDNLLIGLIAGSSALSVLFLGSSVVLAFKTKKKEEA